MTFEGERRGFKKHRARLFFKGAVNLARWVEYELKSAVPQGGRMAAWDHGQHHSRNTAETCYAL